MLDGRFPAANLFTVSLHHSKTTVLEFLLERDMIDISTCCRRPLIPQQLNSTGGINAFNKTSLFKPKDK